MGDELDEVLSVERVIHQLQADPAPRPKVPEVKPRVKFVSYNGDYPNLCRGTLVMEVDGVAMVWPSYCLESGGSVDFDNDWQENVMKGPWKITRWPEAFPSELRDEATALVNKHVLHGCCGGCV